MSERLTTDEYREYMRSDEWRERRKAALERASVRERYLGPRPRCEVCGRQGMDYKNRLFDLDYRDRIYRVEYANGLEVHHLTYRNLGSEEPADLIVLCTSGLVFYHSGYTDLETLGCHERAHESRAFRLEVESIAREREL